MLVGIYLFCKGVTTGTIFDLTLELYYPIFDLILELYYQAL